MKAIAIALVILVFNIAMSGISASGLFENANIYYESEILEEYNQSMPSNVSAEQEIELQRSAGAIVDSFFSTLSWGWILQYIPSEYHDDLGWFIAGMNLISIFFMGLGIVELFLKPSAGGMI